MRISSNQINQALIQGLQRNDTQYAKLLEQMSSGERITRMSDDALGSVRLVGLNRESKSLEQWQKNIDQANSRLSKAETQIDSSLNVLYRMQDLVLAARNGASANKDREALVSELEVLQKALVDFSNAQDEQGNYLFSGSRTDTPPVANTGTGYIYQGDTNPRNVPIAKGVEVNTNITIDDVYFNGGNFFDEIQAVIDDINSGGATYLTTTENALNGIDRTIDGLGRALSNIGARMNTALNLKDAQQDLSLNNQRLIGEIKDLDYVEAISKVNQLETAMTTTQKTFAKLSQQTLFNYI